MLVLAMCVIGVEVLWSLLVWNFKKLYSLVYLHFCCQLENFVHL